MLEENGIELASPPERVFLGAEPIEVFQREGIERAVGTRVTDQYGFAEAAGNASRCEHDCYHEDWEFGVLQCEDGEEQPDGTVRGHVVGTGFSNYAMPFIRYRIGDTASWAAPGDACACGRRSQMIRRIEGRDETYIVTPEGARFMRFALLFRETHSIKEAQVVQRERGAIVVRFVPRAGFARADEDAIRERARTWISPNLRVEFEPVEHIERAPSGKFRAVVRELKD
jgi:phenylacetate-CoA ligase